MDGVGLISRISLVWCGKLFLSLWLGSGLEY